MKGPKASAKMTNMVHSGWMTKSPPERQLHSPFKIFRAHWKKRYFVLCKPSGSLPDQYQLHYYKDEHSNKKKGSINLDQCEQVIEGLDSGVFPYLFAIKTYYKNKVRTYYLATDAEQDMVTWVGWLTLVCGLRPEDQPTDIPALKPLTPTDGQDSDVATANRHSTSLKQEAEVKAPPILPRSVSQQLTRVSYPTPSLLGKSLPEKHRLIDRVESVAPALPEKNRSGQSNNQSHMISVYDYPKDPRPVGCTNREEVSSIYVNPPARSTRGNKPDVVGKDSSNSVISSDDCSLNSGSSTSLYLSPSQDIGRVVTSIDVYSYPPSCESCASSDSDIAPERPPKRDHPQSPYQNVQLSGMENVARDLTATVPAPSEFNLKSSRPSGYDIPPSSSGLQRHELKLSSVTSAPKKCAPADLSSHVYLNTLDSPGSNLSHPGNINNGGHGPELKEKGSDQPLASPAQTGHTGNQAQEEKGPAIFSTKRTRSFKRTVNASTNSPKWSDKAKSIHVTTGSAQRPGLSLRGAQEKANEDKETVHLNLMRSIPAPPQSGTVSTLHGELKYLDLAPPESPLESHGHGQGHPHSHQDSSRDVPTEYREIDFVRTQALNDTKRVKDSERKDDRS